MVECEVPCDSQSETGTRKIGGRGEDVDDGVLLELPGGGHPLTRLGLPFGAEYPFPTGTAPTLFGPDMETLIALRRKHPVAPQPAVGQEVEDLERETEARKSRRETEDEEYHAGVVDWIPGHLTFHSRGMSRKAKQSQLLEACASRFWDEFGVEMLRQSPRVLIQCLHDRSSYLHTANRVLQNEGDLYYDGFGRQESGRGGRGGLLQ